jgi:hypothetical protein
VLRVMAGAGGAINAKAGGGDPYHHHHYYSYAIPVNQKIDRSLKYTDTRKRTSAVDGWLYISSRPMLRCR